MGAVQLQLGDDGILVATMNLPGRPMNVVTDALMAGVAAAVARLAEPGVKGLVLASGKADFCAGGDIDRMSRWTTPQEPFEASMAMKRVLRQLETQGKPVVAAIAGHALGGGLELALFATWSAAQNGADNGAAEFAIPSYFVVDATASWRFGERLAINAGVNNLLDEEYVARVRPGGGGGIDPGAPRNVYVGVSYGW